MTESRIAPQATFNHVQDLAAPPERVFPLLCPTREAEWLEHWRCELVHSRSGFAEEGCIFTTNLDVPATWVVVRHEADRRIEFVVFTADEVVVRYRITLEPTTQGGTRLGWAKTYTAVGPRGATFIAALSPERFDREMRALLGRLEHYLRHSVMLRLTHS